MKIIIISIFMFGLIISGCANITVTGSDAYNFCREKGFDGFKWESISPKNVNFYCINKSSYSNHTSEHYLGFK